MQRVKIALIALVLRRPVLVGSFATLLAVAIGLVGATPWLEWGKAPAPAGEAHFTLRDQVGRQVRLRDQAGKVVLVNFITSRCTTACIQVTHELQGLQKALGDRMDREVLFLSVGLDPKRDTPEALAKFARRHGVVDFRG